MPVVSQAQWRAMQAAKHGHSKLGIPKKVAGEYVKASKGMKIARLPKRKKRT